LLAGVCARGGVGWVLGFVILVPWLRTLDAEASLRGALLGAWVLSIAYTATVFGWLGEAIGAYTRVGTFVGMAVLLLVAPLLQPQFLAFAFMRHLAGRRYGPVLRALAAAAAWVATERLVPRLLDDTLGIGLQPSRLLRQAAEVGGTAGLTLMLLLANEALAAVLARRRDGWRALAAPLATAAAVPVLLAAYGLAVLSALPPAPAPGEKPLRVGLVQSGIVDYERLRREQGTAAVVREVLDTHFAMSWDAVERQHADALLWSETVYPTTFGHPKSEAGATFDREILDTVTAGGVPLVFGTYDRDAAGEYNAAAFVAPGRGLVGMYRKTRLFPLTEHVPAWLDGPALRRWLPWTGTWLPGTGARVFPLFLADGRAIPAVPLICLDDVDAGLALDGARLGGQVILTLSNDAWFDAHGPGAELHLAAATFRSIETRLPQFRVTTNGDSAVVDATGAVIAKGRRGQATLVIGELPVREPPRTLLVAWGDWVGLAAAAFLVLLAAGVALARWGVPSSAEPAPSPADFPTRVQVLPPAARLVAGALRVFARGSLLGLIAVIVFGDGSLQVQTLALARLVALLCLVPEAAAWCVLRAFEARAEVVEGVLVLARGRRRLELPLRDIAAVEPWRVPLPGPGAALRRAPSGARWRYDLALADPWALARAVAAATGAPEPSRATTRTTAYARACAAVRRGWLETPWAKFVLFPLLLAIPAFRLHQHIAYGGAFGEATQLGMKAYLDTFAVWWAAWAIGVMLCAAALRAAIEAGTLAGAFLRPDRVVVARRCLERLGLVALYLGLPAWLAVRILAP
jgi:apolipoprotein N-acyltransferase